MMGPSSEHLLNHDDYKEVPLLYPGRLSGRTFRRKRSIIVVAAILAAVSLCAIGLFSTRATLRTSKHADAFEPPLADPPEFTLLPMMEPEPWPESSEEPQTLPPKAPGPLDPFASLNGPPTMSLWDNLRSDTKYISSWVSAGWTNDVMTYGNLIYLGLITDRVPILGPFTPSHIGAAPAIPFGEVFDVPRLRKLLGKPILEWHEVKDQFSEIYDDIGCWNVWQAVQYREDRPRGSSIPDIAKLDISYTVVPSWVKIFPNYEHDQHSTFWSLARLAFPETRNASLQTPLPSPRHGVSLPPNEHLVCYDYLYYVAAYQPFEYEYDYSPAWRYVAQHMRWARPLEELADKYVRATIGVEDNDSTPPYIGIHVRHRDFANWCRGVPVEDCFANITVIARRVQEVKDELLLRKGLDVKHVIMTSDETDEQWWADVEAQGWLQVDHSKTEQMYGKWYPLLIDAVIQSNGMGFVGTDRSTMTVLARRRVESWHDGAIRTVKWGTPDADNH